MRVLGATLMVWALTSCSDSTAPAAAVFGRWATVVESLGAGYSRSEALNFRSGGVLEHEVRIYRSGRLEQTHRSRYTYTLRNDSLFTSESRLGDHQLLNWVGTPFNRGRIVVDGATLTITYPWFGPADEPITVTTTFFREACLAITLSRCF